MNVDFQTAVKLFFANYATFQGRSTRAEYWWVVLFNILVSCALTVLSALFGLKDMGMEYLSYIYSLVVIVPNVAIAVRRLHDVGKGGGWIFINLIPVIGWIWYLILMLTPSEGDNRFGPSPY